MSHQYPKLYSLTSQFRKASKISKELEGGVTTFSAAPTNVPERGGRAYLVKTDAAFLRVVVFHHNIQLFRIGHV